MPVRLIHCVETCIYLNPEKCLSSGFQVLGARQLFAVLVPDVPDWVEKVN